MAIVTDLGESVPASVPILLGVLCLLAFLGAALAVVSFEVFPDLRQHPFPLYHDYFLTELAAMLLLALLAFSGAVQANSGLPACLRSALFYALFFFQLAGYYYLLAIVVSLWRLLSLKDVLRSKARREAAYRRRRRRIAAACLILPAVSLAIQAALPGGDKPCDVNSSVHHHWLAMHIPGFVTLLLSLLAALATCGIVRRTDREARGLAIPLSATGEVEEEEDDGVGSSASPGQLSPLRRIAHRLRSVTGRGTGGDSEEQEAIALGRRVWITYAGVFLTSGSERLASLAYLVDFVVAGRPQPTLAVIALLLSPLTVLLFFVWLCYTHSLVKRWRDWLAFRHSPAQDGLLPDTASVLLQELRLSGDGWDPSPPTAAYDSPKRPAKRASTRSSRPIGMGSAGGSGSGGDGGSTQIFSRIGTPVDARITSTETSSGLPVWDALREDAARASYSAAHDDADKVEAAAAAAGHRAAAVDFRRSLAIPGAAERAAAEEEERKIAAERAVMSMPV